MSHEKKTPGQATAGDDLKPRVLGGLLDLDAWAVAKEEGIFDHFGPLTKAELERKRLSEEEDEEMKKLVRSIKADQHDLEILKAQVAKEEAQRSCARSANTDKAQEWRARAVALCNECLKARKSHSAMLSFVLKDLERWAAGKEGRRVVSWSTLNRFEPLSPTTYKRLLAEKAQ